MLLIMKILELVDPLLTNTFLENNKNKIKEIIAQCVITNAKTIAELKAAWDTDVLGDSPYK